MEQNLAHLADLPYRGTFGAERPPALSALRLPPAAMPGHDGLRPLKAWRYVGAYSPEIMLCLGSVRVGPLRQSFWAVWDRQRLRERTLIGRREVRLSPGHAAVHAEGVRIELALDEGPGVETISRTGQTYAWTRKQGGVRVRGHLSLGGREHDLDLRGMIDDSAGYFERHTSWRWCAGVGRGPDGRGLAWNLVEGVHDAPESSERTVWVEGVPHEAPASAWDGLRFQAEAERSRRDNLLVIRSTYRQPFGTFSGQVAGLPLAEGYGVTEDHEAWW